MTFIAKPRIDRGAARNELGLTRRDYEGGMSTLCAGCGHDSVTAAIVQACFEMALPPQIVAKLSGIGCSSKTTAYFVSGAHGFNSVHGRMPAIAAGAIAANRQLRYIGVSGDGDSLSIGLGQLGHAVRRNVDMLYILENNGVDGLTKGQFSASADVGTKSKKGERNDHEPLDPVLLALSLGATFVARSFSGDKAQLVPLIKAGLSHRGFALIDVLSPCVTFNDHEGSTKSYAYVREHLQAPVAADYVEARREITVDYAEGDAVSVEMHDGAHVVLRKLNRDYDPTDRGRALAYVQEHAQRNEYVTGLIHVSSGRRDFHERHMSPEEPLNAVPFGKLCPGSATLAGVLQRYRQAGCRPAGGHGPPPPPRPRRAGARVSGGGGPRGGPLPPPRAAPRARGRSSGRGRPRSVAAAHPRGPGAVASAAQHADRAGQQRDAHRRVAEQLPVRLDRRRRRGAQLDRGGAIEPGPALLAEAAVEQPHETRQRLDQRQRLDADQVEQPVVAPGRGGEAHAATAARAVAGQREQPPA